MALSSAIVATFLIIIACLLQVIAYDVCEETGICEHVDNYPTELVRGLIQELKSKNTLFNNDKVDNNDKVNNYNWLYHSERRRIEFSNRFSKGRSFISVTYPKAFRKELCEFKVQSQAPMTAKNENGIMQLIVNDRHHPVQTFNVATCNSREAKCTNSLGFIPNYKGICIQNWALREMIYIDDKNQSAVGYFQVPICCSCKLVRINEMH